MTISSGWCLERCNNGPFSFGLLRFGNTTAMDLRVSYIFVRDIIHSHASMANDSFNGVALSGSSVTWDLHEIARGWGALALLYVGILS